MLVQVLSFAFSQGLPNFYPLLGFSWTAPIPSGLGLVSLIQGCVYVFRVGFIKGGNPESLTFLPLDPLIK